MILFECLEPKEASFKKLYCLDSSFLVTCSGVGLINYKGRLSFMRIRVGTSINSHPCPLPETENISLLVIARIPLSFLN